MSSCTVQPQPRGTPKSMPQSTPHHDSLTSSSDIDLADLEQLPRQSSSIAESLIYSPLPLSPSGAPETIRLLSIHPNTNPTVVSCELRVVKLADAPSYESLSYAWGTPSFTQPIICNGQTMSVTPNLDSALRQLRLEHTARLVWIDAICVNQKDLDERSSQVTLMKQIYTQTRRVIVWLGEDSQGLAETAIGMIELGAEYCCHESEKTLDDVSGYDIGCLKDEHRNSILKGLRSFPALFGATNQTTNVPDPWDAVAWLYSRPWFRRIWVAQEVALAPATVYVGVFEIPCKVVLVAGYWFRRKSYFRSAKERKSLSSANHMLRILDIQGEPFWMFPGSHAFQATDPRDQVVALLGLADDESRAHPLLQPDYTKSVSKVYLDAVRYVVEYDRLHTTTKLSRIFRYAREPLNGKIDEEFPSWVCRWDLPYVGSDWIYRSRWKAQGGSSTQVIADTADPSVVSIQGVRLGTINEINHALHEEGRVDDRIKLLWEWAQEKVHLKYGEKAEEAFVSTITIEREARSDHGPLGPTYLRDYLLNIEMQEFWDERSTPESRAGRARELFQYAKDRSFFFTENVDIGIGSRAAQLGDIICVFFGHPVPYMLRPVNTQFQFLGPCYLEGYMYGKATDEFKAGKRQAEFFDLI